MEKRLYAKPFMSVEQFTPNEYVSLCWWLDGDCFTELYHDDNKDGDYNYLTNAKEYLASNHNNYHSKIPTNKPYFNTKKGDPSPTPVTNDNFYYTSWSTYWTFFRAYDTDSRVTGEFYSYNDGSTTHYFQDYHTDGNHS